MHKKRIVSGDRPTGLLHIGHYVGSVKNRIDLQHKYDCYFFLADLHTLTTKPEKEHILELRKNIHEMVIDYLALGIDPKLCTIYLQSACPAVYELNLIFENLISFNRLAGIPSIKDMARNAHIDPESIPFGLFGYPVLQTADILMPKGDLVPVGKDNEAHIEMSRSIARKFNQYYGEVFPLPDVLLSEFPSLIGTDGQGKMSKSAGNAIFFADDAKVVEKKVMSMYTDPNRIHANVPGTVEGNPVFTYLDIFDPEKDAVLELKKRYREGTIGDVEVKKKLVSALHAFMEPIRVRRKEFSEDAGYVEQVIYEGTRKMIEISNETLKEVRSAMGLGGAWKKIERIARERKEKIS
jgi:tryptophanyl-tRNA synthetase